jgi:RNA polymerase sigma-70 factor, ECF subfamily
LRLLPMSLTTTKTNQQFLEEAFLLVRISQQDESALGKLYDRYARIIYAFAFKSLENVEESEEIVIDVFAQVWRTAHSYDSEKGRVDTWLFMIARSRILDRLRKLQRSTKKQTASREAYLQSPNTSPDPIEDVVISERRSVILAALDQLNPKNRQVLELAYYKGLSHQQIAEAMNLPLGTVKSCIRLSLNKLRSTLKET